MGKNELMVLQIAKELIQMILDRLAAGEDISDEELDEATRKRKEAVEKLNQT